jgi:hypothetical protein
MDKITQMARAVAAQTAAQDILYPPVITVPSKKIRNPKEWTIMESAGVALNGSYVRYFAGQKLDDPLTVKLLRDQGVKIEATA